MKRYSTLKILKVEAKEVGEMVEVVKTTVMKKIIRRRDYRAKQIGMEEDTIKDAVKDIIPTSSVTNVKNMATMQIIVTLTNVTIVAELVTMQEIVEPRKRWKKQSTKPWMTQQTEAFS